MTSASAELDRIPIAVRWWAFVIRGLAAIAFGILTFAKPSISLLALVILWGSYAIIDGVFNLVLSIRGARILPGWGWLLAQGVVSIAAGVLTFVWPGITAIALLFVIAGWAILTGITEIATAIRLRRVLRREWLLAASGVLSIAFGVSLVVSPGSGALAVTWLIGAYALVFGALLVALGIQLRRWAEIAKPLVSPERAPSRA